MKRIPLATGLMAVIILFILSSQILLNTTFSQLYEIVELIETQQGDLQANAKQIKDLYEQRQAWLLVVADNNLILQLGMAIETLDPDATSEEIVAHTKHIKAELTRIKRLLLALL